MIAVVGLPGARDSTPRLTVPLSAVVRPPGTVEYTVYVVEKQEGRTLARRRFVKLGSVLGNRVVVTEGVARGEAVVVKGTTQIVDGEQIRVLSETG